MDFATSCPLVRPALPRIRFLFVGSRLCSTLPSDSPSRFCPCASLVLHLHQVAQGTFTPKLSDMSDTQDAARRLRRCRRIRDGILDCRCARRSARRQVGTKGWSCPIEQRDVAFDLNEPPHAHHDQFAEFDAHNSPTPTPSYFAVVPYPPRSGAPSHHHLVPSPANGLILLDGNKP
jgi:hypothetical protein